MGPKLLLPIAGLGLAVLAAACGGGDSSDNPKGKVDAGADTGKTNEDAQTGDAGPDAEVDAAPKPILGTYFAACLTTLAAGQVNRVLRFYVETSFTPAIVGGGKLTMKLTPMKVGPNEAPPASVSKSETVGNSFSITNVSVNGDGVFPGLVGKVAIPGTANPISGRDMAIEDTDLPGRFADTGVFCTQLAGHVTEPTDLLLEGQQNTCLFHPSNEGAALPTIAAADFTPGCN